MKINLPIFNDEDKKDAITCQSWHWDIMVYCQAVGPGPHPPPLCDLLPTGLPRVIGEELSHWHHFGWHDCCVWISTTTMSRLWMPWTRSFSNYWMADKEMVSDWEDASLEAPPNPCGLIHRKGFCWTKSLNWSKVHFHSGLPKWLKAMVAYLKATNNKKTNLDYLQVAWEA